MNNEYEERYVDNKAQLIQANIQNPYSKTAQNWNTHYITDNSDFNDKIFGQRAISNSSKIEQEKPQNADLKSDIENTNRPKRRKRTALAGNRIKNKFVQEYDQVIMQNIFKNQSYSRKKNYAERLEMSHIDVRAIQRQIRNDDPKGKIPIINLFRCLHQKYNRFITSSYFSRKICASAKTPFLFNPK